ncbi:Crp/Fnr family transcriptional regulator [Rhizobium sp. 1399]|uniref:Crp/Fnr family transcriptional regulator n=1 Tax=Rhizobium sp. 1399 TaxID=2817758 RepID=UPI00285C4AFF|nr:Crp/Fnr family transcriptional regulator [Rhizobium sp. 1399]MDR6671187.1 CRP-like cAMP-binding protein [Rhizobium sp. 1399]
MLFNSEQLLQSDLFDGLSNDTARRLATLARRRVCMPEEEIFAEGEPGTHVVYVASGVVRLTRTESSGRDADIRVCEPGDFIAEYVIALGGNYAHGACAGALSALALFEAAALRTLADKCPQLERNLLKISARHLLEAFDCIAGDRLHMAAQRVANFLLRQCPETALQATFHLPYKKQILAGKLGLGPEALSRAFAALAQCGVDVKGRTVRIENVVLLRQVC